MEAGLNLLVLLEGLMAASAFTQCALHRKSSREKAHHGLRGAEMRLVPCACPLGPRAWRSLQASVC